MGKGGSSQPRESLIEEEVPNYYLELSEEIYEIEPPREDSDSEFDFQGSYGVSVRVKGLHASQHSGPEVSLIGKYHNIYGYDRLKPGEIAYIVVVTYQTGGTFGSHGAWTVPAIKRNKLEAERIARLCERVDLDPQTTFKRDWEGYFESLTSVEVVNLEVR